MIELETRIRHVTVFRDGARVTRSGKRVLDPGPHKVAIKGVTQYAARDSFRVSGRGPASLASIDVQSYTVVHEPGSDLQPLLDQIEKLQNERLSVNDELELQKSRVNNGSQMIGQFAAHFGMVYAAGEGEVSQLTDMDKNFTKMQSDSQVRIRELTEKIKLTDDKIQVLRSNLAKIDAERTTDTFYEVQVNLEATEKSEIELDVTYQVSGAGWIPKYDVDLRPDSSSLRRIAAVTNRTQEAWEKVNLVVSTATAKPVTAVEPTPFVVRVYVPPPPRPMMAKKAMAPGGGLGRAMMPEAAPMAAPPPPAPKPAMVEEFATASEAASGISVYELPKPVTIPFDNDYHPVTLTEEKLESKTVHYWYTDGMAEVVAQDEVVNGDSVLLPGPMKVYAEGDYIGETSIAMISPREKFKLGTRVAYDVKSKKKLIEREVEKAGITRGKLRRFYAYRLEVENYSKRTVELRIVDRVPHSLNPAIEIKMDSEKLGLEKYELGVMEWKRSLVPAKKDTIEYSFEVLWEKGVVISPPLP